MEIREARSEEAEKVTRELWLPLAQEMEKVSSYNQLKEDLDIQSSIDHKREKLESKDGYIFLAEAEDLAGYISIWVKESKPCFSRGDKLKIIELFVKKDYRGQGIASNLMDKAEKVAEQENCDTIELNVNVENKAAKELYRKHDLEAERERMIKEI